MFQQRETKIRSDDDEYSSDNHERGKGRYQDILDSMQRKFVPQLKASLGMFVERYCKVQNQKIAQAQGMNLRIS